MKTWTSASNGASPPSARASNRALKRVGQKSQGLDEEEGSHLLSQEQNAELVWLRQGNHIANAVRPLANKGKKWPVHARFAGGGIQLPITANLPAARFCTGAQFR
ncbi:hypothetical protein GCM10025859_19100 [Alicyclobacillus fastidiosus]|nr:hypothetical protein GCM10025859_19100 [Alicyclobacillus fastidiosus]